MYREFNLKLINLCWWSWDAAAVCHAMKKCWTPYDYLLGLYFQINHLTSVCVCFLKLLFYGSYIRWIDYKYCLCLFSYHLINLKLYPYIDSTWRHQNKLNLIIWQCNKCLQMFSKFWTGCWIIILISYCGTPLI